MKAIRKAKVTYAILFLAALVLFLAVKPGTVTYAASKKNGLKNYKTITVEKSQKIKGMVYSMEKNGDGYTVIAAKMVTRKRFFPTVTVRRLRQTENTCIMQPVNFR